MANDVTLTVGAETKDASKQISKFQKDTSKTLKGIESSFALLKTAAIGLAGVFVSRQIVNGINAITDAAAIQEKAVAQLNTALKLSGDFSEDASKSFQDFASALQSTSTVGDEVILQQASIAKSFGVSNDQAKQLVAAAVDLSAATGITLEGAVRNLGKTFSGLTGELGEIIPQLKGFTAEQLKSGEALKFVTQRFGGAAEALTKTFSGASEQASNTFGDFLEVLGSFIAKNPQVIAGINLFSNGVQNLIQITKDNSVEIQKFVTDGLQLIIQTIPGVIGAVALIGRAFQGVSLGIGLLVTNISNLLAAFLRLDFVKSLLEGLSRVFDTFTFIVTESLASIVELISKIPGASSVAKRFGLDLEAVNDSLKELTIGAKASAKEGSDLSKSLEQTAASLDKTALASVNTTDKVARFFQNFEDGTNVVKDLAQGIGNQLNDIGSAAGKAGETLKENLSGGGFLDSVINLDFGASFSAAGTEISDAFKTSTTSLKESVGSLFSGENIKAGMIAGAQEGFALGAAALESVLTGGFANTIAGFLNTIGNLPAAFLESFSNLDKTISTLVDSFPKIVSRLVSSLPKITQSIVSAIPKLVKALSEGLPKAFDEILKALPKVIDALVKEIPKLAKVLINVGLKVFDAILKELPKIITVLVDVFVLLIDAVSDLFESLLKRLPAILTSIFQALPKIVRALAREIPQIIVVLAENIGPIVTALISGIIVAIPEIIFALIDELILKGGIFKIVIALVKALAIELPIAIVKGVTDGFGKSFSGFGEQLGLNFKSFGFSGLTDKFSAFGDIFSGKIKFPSIKIPDALRNPPFIDKLQDLFEFKKLKEILDNFNPIKLGGGGGKGGITGLGFAEGGVVPAGFPNDTFPAALSSGELVIPRDDVAKLSAFLDKQERPQQQFDLASLLGGLNRSSERSLTINLSIGEEQISEVLLNLDRQGFRTA